MVDKPADEIIPKTSILRKHKRLSQSKILPGPISYKLYSLFLKYLVNREIPTEEVLNDSEISILISECQSFEVERIAKDTLVQQDVCAHNDDKTVSVDCEISVRVPDSNIGCPSTMTVQSISSEVSNHSSAKTKASYPVKDNMDDLVESEDALEEDPATLKVQKVANRVCKTTNVHGHGVSANINADSCEDTKSQSNDSALTSLTDHFEKIPAKTERSSALSNSTMLKKFFLWAKKMYVKVNSVVEGKDLQIVSLMSKRSNREIAPKESFEQIIEAVHSRRGQVGQNHLSISSTITEIKKGYTFGCRDFGMSEELVRQTVSKCRSAKCVALYFQIASEKHIVPADGDSGSANDQHEPLIVDKFYQEVAHIIVEDEIQFHRGLLQDDKEVKSKINSIKRSSPFWHARVAKRKADEERSGQSVNRARPSLPANIVETMSLDTAYECLAQLTTQMRHELLIAFVGERRHQDNLARSIAASQALVRRCQAITNAIAQSEAAAP